MANKSVLVAGQIMAHNVDSLIKNAKYASGAVENGHVVTLGDLSSTAGEEEVYVAALPATAGLATDVFYMVNEPVIVMTEGYKGLNDNPQNFEVEAGKVFNAFRPQIGDEVVITEAGLGGTKSTNTYIVPANATGKLTWAADADGVSTAFKLVETTSVEIPSANFWNSKAVAYKFQCVKAV